MGGRLAEDHATAARLSEGLNRLHPRLSATVPQTNIVQVETADSGMGNAQWVQALAAEGVLTRPGRDAAALRDPSPHRRGRHRPRRANLRPGAAGQLNRLFPEPLAAWVATRISSSIASPADTRAMR